jgi:hypothetical protein
MLTRLAAALAALTLAAAAPPPPAAPDEGARLFAAGDFDGAAVAFGKAAAADPKAAPPRFSLARIALYRNRLDEAEAHAREVLVIDPAQDAARRILQAVQARRELAASTTWTRMPPQGVILPFLVDEPLPLVQLTIGGRLLTLVLDTGAPELVLEPDVAQALGLKMEAPHAGVFAGGATAQVQATVVPEVHVGPVTVRDVKASVIPMGAASMFGGTRVDGAVGTAFLSRFVATIDYPAHRLVLRPRGSGLPLAAAGVTRVPIWLVGDHFIFAKGAVNALENQLMLVDSGGAGVGFSPEAAEIEAAHITLDKDHAGQGVGGGGAVNVIPALIERLCVGDACQAKVQGLYTPQGSPLRNFPFKTAGIVSHLFLERYAVTFDFDRMEMGLASSSGAKGT